MKRGLHIAYVCADKGVPVGGRKGASAHVTELVRALVGRGAHVRIVATRTADAANADGFVAPVFDVSAERTARAIGRSIFEGSDRPRTHARAAEARGLMLNQAVAKTLERLHKRWRVDAVYERYSLWSYAGLVFARTARLPFVLEVNAPLRREQARYRTLDNEAAAADIEHFLFSGAGRVAVPSSQLLPYVVEHGARASAVQVMPNAAEPARYSRRGQRRKGRNEPFVVGFLGTLKPWHGLDNLFRAFRILYRGDASYRLLIVGDGPMRRSLEKSARSMGMHAAVEFSGDVAHDEVPELLARMDVGVAPYSALPGFYFSPLKLFEYMAAGLPVVASDIGQIREIVTNRKTGLLVPPGAIRPLAAAISGLRSRPAAAVNLSRAARTMIGRRYTWRHNADRVIRAFHALHAAELRARKG